MRTVVRAAAFVVAMAVLAGCGGADDRPARTIDQPAGTGAAQPTGAGAGQPEGPGTDRVFPSEKVKGALLTVTDLPTGWSVRPDVGSSSDDSSDTYGDCPKLRDVIKNTSLTKAPQVEFTSPAGSTLGEGIVSLSEADAKTLLSEFSDGVTTCKKLTGKARFSTYDIYLTALSFPMLGDDTFALRTTATLSGTTINLDMVMVRRGGLIIVTTHAARGVIDTMMTENVTRRALAKVDEVLR